MSFTPARDRSDAGACSAVRRAGIGRADAREAIFGSFDGMTSTRGPVSGAARNEGNRTPHRRRAIGIAVAAPIGMGARQYLSDEKRSARKAVVMAVATLAGSVLPALPFIFGSSLPSVLASVAITLLAAAVIGHYRGYVVTYPILLAVSVLTVGLSIAVA
jgi:VIT1/CCC1 family predicted Fe2+/Mn2+ transporter